MARHPSARLSESRSQRRRTRSSSESAEPLEDRTLLSGASGRDDFGDGFHQAAPILLGDDFAQAGTIGPDDVDVFTFIPPQKGRLIARLHAQGIGTRLSLLDEEGRLLVQSEGISPGDRTNRIDQHLTTRIYYLRVEGLDRAGDYLLETDLVAASAPFQELAVGDYPAAFVSSDFNGDGIIDLATANAGPFDPFIGTFASDVSVLLGRGDGTFQEPGRLAVGALPSALVVADLNGDGRPDLATANGSSADVSVLLGRGDGTFQEQRRLGVGSDPTSLVVADLDGDGRPDLATANGSSADVSVLLGRGDGTFQEQRRLAVGSYPSALVVADFDGDGRLDLSTANAGLFDRFTGTYASDVSVLLGRGDGTFRERKSVAVGDGPSSLVVADLDGDGRPDLATANRASGDVSVLLGHGDGTFREQRRFAVGDRPSELVMADLNGDGRPDLATSNRFSADASVLLGRGDGTFLDQRRLAVGTGPYALTVEDLNGDGRPDLATANRFSADASVLLGRGDGTFLDQRRLAVGDRPYGLVVADLNGDGRPDLATSNTGRLDASGTYSDSDVSVLLGRGDGTFQVPRRRLVVGDHPYALVVADLNGDGRPDLTTANRSSDDVSVLLGRGDGTFQAQRRLAVGDRPTALVVADLNGDGRPDLATANAGSYGSVSGTYAAPDVSVFLGRGDGTFQEQRRLAVGSYPSALAAGDLNGDGRPDLVVARRLDADVSVFLGRGDGTFQEPRRLAVGDRLYALAVADLNGDGHLDLAAANGSSADVSVLLGRGDGTFHEPRRLAVGSYPSALVVGDFNGDGRPDLATANAGDFDVLTRTYSDSDVSVLLGRGDGTFEEQRRLAAGDRPSALVVADLNGDGRPDLATTNAGRSDRLFFLGPYPADVSVVLGRGDGTFQEPRRLTVGDRSNALAAADLNGDGRPDLVTADRSADDVSVGLNLGDGTFARPGPFATASHAIPLPADLDRDGADDVLVVNQAGEILWRRGRPQERGTFDPPIVVNPGVPARDVAALESRLGTLVASVDAQADRVSLFTRRSSRFFLIGSLPTGRLPAQIETADLNGDGRSDLVVRNAGDGTATVYLGDGAGNFLRVLADLLIGLGASDLRLADVDRSGAVDLVVTNQATGDVRIFYNRGDASFARESRYFAGNGLYLADGDGTITLEETAGVAVGTFTRNGLPDLVTLNPGSNTLGVLVGLGGGAFANPRRLFTDRPIEFVRTADLNGDGVTDVALLGAGRVTIHLGDGRGGFATPIAVDAGLNPTGLSLAQVDGDGTLDLLAGNDFGDVLVLRGNGDGTFQPFQKADRGVALAVADLDGDGRNDFVFASQALDRVTVDFGQDRRTRGSTILVGDRSRGLLGPGAVELADLTGDGQSDLIVANSGSNNVLIYPGLGGGRFGPALNGGNGFFAGTNPVGITVADVDTDGDLDLVVANRGSNDVSILLGQRTAAGYSLVPGPRIRAGIGPVATVVRDFDGLRGLDLLISNSLSDEVLLIPGAGGGFFDDRSPTPIPVGNNPGPLFVGAFDARPGLDFIALNRGSNDLTLVSDFARGTRLSSRLPSGGTSPVAGLAGDFNGDGLFDLAVANNGDGRLALFLGGSSGPGMSAILSLPDLAHPTALALDPFGGGLLSFYVSIEGLEAATLLTFTLGAGGPFLPTRPEILSPVVTLVALTDSPLTLIATVLIVALEAPIETTSQEDTARLILQSAMSTSPPTQATAGSDPTRDPPADPEPGTPPAWVRLLVGLDKGLERSRRASHEEVFPGDEPSAPAVRPMAFLDVLLDRRWPSDRLREGLALGVRQAGAAVVRAIDEIVRSLGAMDRRRPPGEHPVSSPEEGRAETGPVSVSLTAAALLARRSMPPRRGRRGRRVSTGIG